MGFAERQLLRRVKRFIPPEAVVVAVDAAQSDVLESTRPAGLILTDESLLIVTAVKATSVVTTIRFEHLVRSDPRFTNMLVLDFADWDREEIRNVNLDFRRTRDNAGFRQQFQETASAWFARGRLNELPAACRGWIEPKFMPPMKVALMAWPTSLAINVSDSFRRLRMDWRGARYHADLDHNAVLLEGWADSRTRVLCAPEDLVEWCKTLESFRVSSDATLMDSSWDFSVLADSVG